MSELDNGQPPVSSQDRIERIKMAVADLSRAYDERSDEPKIRKLAQERQLRLARVNKINLLEAEAIIVRVIDEDIRRAQVRYDSLIFPLGTTSATALRDAKLIGSPPNPAEAEIPSPNA